MVVVPLAALFTQIANFNSRLFLFCWAGRDHKTLQVAARNRINVRLQFSPLLEQDVLMRGSLRRACCKEETA
jgi:hypothetical protein